jgi:hypothetical protein
MAMVVIEDMLELEEEVALDDIPDIPDMSMLPILYGCDGYSNVASRMIKRVI